MMDEERKAFEAFCKNRDLMRKVYNTKDGAIMLTDILNDLQFFSTHIEGESEIAMENSAKRLLYKLGIWQPHNAFRIVEALLAMEYSSKEEHK